MKLLYFLFVQPRNLNRIPSKAMSAASTRIAIVDGEKVTSGLEEVMCSANLRDVVLSASDIVLVSRWELCVWR